MGPTAGQGTRLEVEHEPAHRLVGVPDGKLELERLGERKLEREQVLLGQLGEAPDKVGERDRRVLGLEREEQARRPVEGRRRVSSQLPGDPATAPASTARAVGSSRRTHMTLRGW